MRTLPGPSPVPRPWSPLAFLLRLPARYRHARQASGPRRKSQLRGMRQPPRCARETTPRSRHLQPGLPSFPRPTARRTRQPVTPNSDPIPGPRRSHQERRRPTLPRRPARHSNALSRHQANPRNRDPGAEPEPRPGAGPRANPRTPLPTSAAARPGACGRSRTAAGSRAFTSAANAAPSSILQRTSIRRRVFSLRASSSAWRRSRRAVNCEIRVSIPPVDPLSSPSSCAPRCQKFDNTAAPA